jgi:hypothetical protein
MMEKICSICNEVLLKIEAHNKVNFLGFECFVCNECMEKEDLKGEINPDIEYEKE